MSRSAASDRRWARSRITSYNVCYTKLLRLLGLAGLQARLQILQSEAYQRAQALMLLKDMAGRIANNRNDADEYVTGADAPLRARLDTPDNAIAVTGGELVSRRTADGRASYNFV